MRAELRHRRPGRAARRRRACARLPCAFVTELGREQRRDLDARVRLAMLYVESPIVALRHHAPVGHFFGVPSVAEISEAWLRTWEKLSAPWPDGANPLLAPTVEARTPADEALPGLSALVSAVAGRPIGPGRLLRDIGDDVARALDGVGRRGAGSERTTRSTGASYLAEFHRERAGMAEAVLSRALAGDHSPYRWLARAVSADAKVVLDLACGSGPMSRELAQPGRMVVGLDLLRARAGAGGRRGPGPWVQADALQLPFRDESVDVVTSSMGLVVVTADGQVLAEVARVLRPGGVLAGIAPALRPLGRGTSGC